ncbi:MAG: peptidylprolyl isomerase [Lachnospiraceae bacterium]|nr:peptidylprolyl isomerase [Lachnospiraceae bacterium]
MNRSNRRKHKNRKIRIAALSIAAVLLCISLSACSEVKLKTSAVKDAFIQIEDATCSRAEAIFMLMEEKAVYEEGQNPADFWEREIGSENMNDYVKDVVVDKLTRYTAAEVLSDRLGVYPSEEAKNKAGEDAVTSWTKISGLYNVDEYEITAADVNDLYLKKATYDAVYNKITTDAVADITEDSTRVMLADYVVIPASAGEETAETIYKSIKEGAEFSDACSAAGYQMLAEQQIKRGEMNSTVDNIAFALNDGEMSEVIVSKEGYYIMRCIDDKLLLESAANYNEVMANAKEAAFRDTYYEFSKESKMSFDSGYWKKIKISEIK